MQQDLQERQRRADRIEALIQEVASFPDPRARAVTEELIQALLDMYGEGLARVLELTREAGTTGHALIESFVGDELLASLFVLHGLHPFSIEARVSQALVKVRASIKSHGGSVELIKVENSVAYLRLQGSCNGCSSSSTSLTKMIEDALYRAVPDLERLDIIDDAQPQQASVPLKFIPPKRRERSEQPVASGQKAVERR